MVLQQTAPMFIIHHAKPQIFYKKIVLRPGSKIYNLPGHSRLSITSLSINF